MKSSPLKIPPRRLAVLGGVSAVSLALAAFTFMQPAVEMAPAMPPVQPPLIAHSGGGNSNVLARPPVAASGAQGPAVPAPATSGGGIDPAPTLPSSGADRLAQMDALRAQIEESKLKAELAKYEAQQRDAARPANSPTSMSGGLPSVAAAPLPPMPIFPVGGGQMPAGLDMPPLPPGRGGMEAPRPRVANSGGLQFLEAWGAGNDIQARIQTASGERIVKVGDAIAGGRVTSISGSALTIRDAKGNTRQFN